MNTYSDESVKIFEKIFDDIPKKTDYLTRKEFNAAIQNNKTGKDIIFFCAIAGKPIFFLFEQADTTKTGKIYKEEFVNLLTIQRVKKKKKK